MVRISVLKRKTGKKRHPVDESDVWWICFFRLEECPIFAISKR